jgi:hypothetical protein
MTVTPNEKTREFSFTYSVGHHQMNCLIGPSLVLFHRHQAATRVSWRLFHLQSLYMIRLALRNLGIIHTSLVNRETSFYEVAVWAFNFLAMHKWGEGVIFQTKRDESGDYAEIT